MIGTRTENIHHTRLVDSLRINRIIRAGDVVDTGDGPRHGRVPSVIILGCKAGDQEASSLKRLRQYLIVEKTTQGEAEAFDPVLCRQVYSRPCGQAAVSRR